MLDNALQRRIIETLLQRLAKKIKHEDPVLVGVSFGGIIVQRYQKLFPLKKLLLFLVLNQCTNIQSICKFLEKQKPIKFFLLIGLMILKLLLDLFWAFSKKKKWNIVGNIFLIETHFILNGH